MPSARDCADRLREQAYKTLLPQIQDLEEELQKVSSLFSTEIRHIEHKLEALRHTELPATEPVLDQLLGEAIRKRDLEGNALALFARTLRSKETQEEILTLLLDTAASYFPKVALFALRGDRFVGWSSRGFSETASRSISTDSFPQSDCPEFGKALEELNPSTAAELSDLQSLRRIREDARGPWRLFPLRVLQRPAAVLLAGEADGFSCRPDAVSVLMDCAALQLENIALKILQALGGAKPETASPAPATPAQTVRPHAFDTAAREEAECSPEQAGEPEMAVEPPSAAEPGPVASDFASEPESSMPSAAYAEEEKVSDIAETGFPASEPEPSPAVSPAPAPMPEEEKLHADAKRFARLLVSEIKLYNEQAVVEGRQNRDLYLRLKKDVDRSREMYEKRVSPAVVRKMDYFHDEIVRILGDNDASTLGSDYPGPRIES